MTFHIGGFFVLENIRILALLCSIGSILIVLGIILDISPIIQIIMLILGLVICCICMVGLGKAMLREKSK